MSYLQKIQPDLVLPGGKADKPLLIFKRERQPLRLTFKRDSLLLSYLGKRQPTHACLYLASPLLRAAALLTAKLSSKNS
jgi:hypothetical protein